MPKTIGNGENAGYEGNVADSLHILAAIRQLVYLVDDEDALAIMTGIAASAARIRRRTIQEMHRRKGTGPAGNAGPANQGRE